MLNIIGCFLALVPLCVSSPQPLKANNISGFFGAYNFREIDYEYLTDDPHDYNFDNLTEGIYEKIGFYYSTDKTYQTYDHYSINYDNINLRWDFQFNDIGGPLKHVYLYYYDTAFVDQLDDTKYFTIYFPTYTYFEQSIANIFNFFFTNQVNTYHERYTGFYTFNATISGSYSLYGSVAANNSLFNYYNYNTSYIRYYYLPNTTDKYNLYENSTFQSSKSIYFSSVFFPTDLKNYMETRGVFDFIPSTNISDFEDLFFALADTPIYYITTWFNFELLGFNFGVALVSLLCLVLIVFLVKKIT